MQRADLNRERHQERSYRRSGRSVRRGDRAEYERYRARVPPAFPSRLGHQLTVRFRVTDLPHGRRVQCARFIRGLSATIWEAILVRDQLRREGRARLEGARLHLVLKREEARGEVVGVRKRDEMAPTNSVHLRIESGAGDFSLEGKWEEAVVGPSEDADWNARPRVKMARLLE
jgi:hypothetical protein